MADSSDSGESGPYTEAVTTRITPQEYDRYEEYINRENIGKSEALRRLIRAGLDEKLDRNDTETTDAAQSQNVATSDLLLLFGGFGVFGILAGDPIQAVYPVTALLLIGGIYLRTQNNE